MANAPPKLTLKTAGWYHWEGRSTIINVFEYAPRRWTVEVSHRGEQVFEATYPTLKRCREVAAEVLKRIDSYYAKNPPFR